MYIGDYTTQLYGDDNKPWNKDLVIKQPVWLMESKGPRVFWPWLFRHLQSSQTFMLDTKNTTLGFTEYVGISFMYGSQPCPLSSLWVFFFFFFSDHSKSKQVVSATPFNRDHSHMTYFGHLFGGIIKLDANVWQLWGISPKNSAACLGWLPILSEKWPVDPGSLRYMEDEILPSYIEAIYNKPWSKERQRQSSRLLWAWMLLQELFFNLKVQRGSKWEATNTTFIV